MKFAWEQLPQPFFALAPMEDVTDTVFRRIVADCGRPDVFFTEFTSVDGLFSKGHDFVAKRLEFTPHEFHLIAQFWGMQPENYFKAARMLGEMGFSGIDINMGCPVRDVVKLGACSALIKNHSLAQEIIQATQEGARELPVSVKTRIGFQTIQTEEWIGFLLSQNLPALTIHGRTTKEQSQVPAHWDEIAKAVQLRDQIHPATIIIGNGDILSREEGLQKVEQTGVDGIMIGRGVFHDLWVFNTKFYGDRVSLEDKLNILQKHSELFVATWGEQKPYQVMKKFFKCYVTGFPGSSELRSELMACQTHAQVVAKIAEYQSLQK